jgi:hypothetical protein
VHVFGDIRERLGAVRVDDLARKLPRRADDHRAGHGQLHRVVRKIFVGFARPERVGDIGVPALLVVDAQLGVPPRDIVIALVVAEAFESVGNLDDKLHSDLDGLIRGDGRLSFDLQNCVVDRVFWLFAVEGELLHEEISIIWAVGEESIERVCAHLAGLDAPLHEAIGPQVQIELREGFFSSIREENAFGAEDFMGVSVEPGLDVVGDFVGESDGVPTPPRERDDDDAELLHSDLLGRVYCST